MTDRSVGDRPHVAVVGSVNLDLSVRVDRFPDAGETVIGRDLVLGGGGKGANQAVALARLGRSVAMVGRVGDDDAGRDLTGRLEADGVDVDAVFVVPRAPSGLAVIEVDDAGENRIVVVSGANATVETADLDRAGDLLATAPVILTQLEIPTSVVESLARRPRRGRLVLNPAPAVAGLDLTGVDAVVPNRGELGVLARESEPTTVDEVVDLLTALDGDLEAAVVTLGGNGAVVVTGLGSGQRRVTEIPAEPVDVVDTTAAGDAFCAGLADGLCRGDDFVTAARWAGRVAAAAVTVRGAQDSLPRRAQVQGLFGSAPS